MSEIDRGYSLMFGKKLMHAAEMLTVPKTAIRKYPLCGGMTDRYWGPDVPGNEGFDLTTLIDLIDNPDKVEGYGLPWCPRCLKIAQNRKGGLT